MKSLIVVGLLVFVAFLAVSEAIGKIDCSHLENEEYQCGSACQTECRNLGKPCSIINIRCNDACYCKKGFARDSSGRCIEESKCRKGGY